MTARSKSAQPVSRGSSRAQTGCPYSAESVDPHSRATRSSAPRKRAADGRARTMRCCRRPRGTGLSPGPLAHPLAPAPRHQGTHPGRSASRAPIVDLLRRQSLVVAVVPLDEVGVDDGSIAQACQLARLSRPLHRAAENELKYFGGEYRPHPLCKPATVIGQWNVRCTGVLAAEAPRGLPMPDREHVHVRLPPAGSDVVSLRRTNRRRSRFLPPPPRGDLGHV